MLQPQLPYDRMHAALWKTTKGMKYVEKGQNYTGRLVSEGYQVAKKNEKENTLMWGYGR